MTESLSYINYLQGFSNIYIPCIILKCIKLHLTNFQKRNYKKYKNELHKYIFSHVN